MIIDSPRRREQLAAIAARMPAHVERLSWSANQIRDERQRTLRETLAYAKAKSPWHASRLGHIDPQSFTEADMQALQTERGATIDIMATGPIDLARLKQEVVAALAKAGLANAAIEINIVSALERHKETGKLKRFIRLPKP